VLAMPFPMPFFDDVISDPWFYTVAIPAVLLMGISKSGFGSGFGSLAVPIMALAISVPKAAAIFMPILLVMDLMGLVVFRRHLDGSLMRFLLPLGLLGTVVGTLTFQFLPTTVVSALVGALTLLFLLQRKLTPKMKVAKPWPKPVGALLAVLSGFTSFVAHAGGPPINAYILGMRMQPINFAATLAVFFFVINLSKWVPYGYLGLLNWQNFQTSLLLMPLAPIGVWIGVTIAKRIQMDLFYKLVEVGMLLTGLKLVSDWLLK
jgi:uncharacterized membrane protein YfcA